MSEGDERQIHRVQHHFDRQQHRDEVAAQHHAHGTDGEQHARQREIVIQVGHYFGPALSVGWRPASAMAPIMAIRIRMEVASNANP